MRQIGFSTGALARGDFRYALDILADQGIHAVELSALRESELDPLLRQAGRAEVFDLHLYGLKTRTTTAGCTAFTGQPASDPLTTAPRKAKEATDA